MSVEIYENITYGDYEKLPGVRQSELSKIADSPAHLKYHLDHRSEDVDTEALRVGSALDALLLEPKAFNKHFVEAPDCDRRTKEGKAAWERFTFDNPNKTVLKKDEYQQVCDMAASVRKYKTAMTLISEATPQLVVVWNDATTGVKCKCRVDGWVNKFLTAFDLKTTRDISRFQWSIVDYGYARQGAFYLDALNAAGLNPQHFVFMAIDKTPPYGMMFFRLREDVIDVGRASYKKLLATYAECQLTQKWPCYPDELRDIGLTDYQKEKILA